jgi:hypothetical protein
MMARLQCQSFRAFDDGALAVPEFSLAVVEQREIVHASLGRNSCEPALPLLLSNALPDHRLNAVGAIEPEILRIGTKALGNITMAPFPR